MKIKWTSVFGVFTLCVGLLLGCKAQNSTPVSVNGVSIKEIYSTNCSGCHGEQLQHFKRLKTYENTKPSLVKMIKDGDEELGMPAFGKTLSDTEIAQISQYILDFDYSENHQAATSVNSSYSYETVVEGLEIPWSFEFLPNGDMLIAERKGVLSRLTKEGQLQEITGLPAIRVKGQGGLLDLKLHPNYATNGWIYIAYSYVSQTDENTGNTAIIRGKLNGNKLINKEELYMGYPEVSTAHHYGTRMVFDKNNYLYFANGDRGKRDDFPQKLDNSNGKIHRIKEDGSIPEDNPFVNTPNAIQSIYSYGHRNPQGLAIHPLTGEIWEHEHGPKGGDEINIIKPGLNYGWPIISYGINYVGTKFTDITEKEGMEQPIHYYKPSIAPCGMTFLDSNVYGDWKGSLFIGSLRFRYLERLVFNGNQVIYQEKLLEELNSRVRDVRVGPDGYLYVALEDPGRIIKIIR